MTSLSTSTFRGSDIKDITQLSLRGHTTAFPMTLQSYSHQVGCHQVSTPKPTRRVRSVPEGCPSYNQLASSCLLNPTVPLACMALYLDYETALNWPSLSLCTQGRFFRASTSEGLPWWKKRSRPCRVEIRQRRRTELSAGRRTMGSEINDH
ncbi:hypothetical protein N1851_015927 [Merluccius polli]|uniref:Uncharacterized protein n=1 Tax=Merluccius polli TaxID=89951 RepID=A0AA47NZX6_MERPO|nr:hypothetical protein N1851_015927 [Merluccius polli]